MKVSYSKIEQKRIICKNLKMCISYCQCRSHSLDKITINFHMQKVMMFLKFHLGLLKISKHVAPNKDQVVGKIVYERIGMCTRQLGTPE